MQNTPKELKMGTTQKVKVEMDLIHYLPFSVTNKRTKGWEMIKDYGKYKTISRAWETITDTDIFILIAAVKAFQDANQDDIEQGQIIHDRPTIALKINIHTFMFNYLDNHDKDYLLQSLRRLSSYQIFFVEKNHEAEHRYMLGYEVKDNILTLILNKKWYDACVKNGWSLKFDYIRQLQKTARALYLYIAAQDNTALYQQTLERALGLTATKTDNRKSIKRAFQELYGLGAIKGYSTMKTPKGWLFRYDK
jgi:hypothetical protein